MCKKNENKVQFHIQRIYAKDISFESPVSPGIFKVIWKPDIKIDLKNNFTKICVNLYEVVLCVTVTAVVAETVAFLCQVKQAGIFDISGLNKNQILHCVNVCCPSILFPYVRECISNQISRGTFPQYDLHPINFDSLFTAFLKDKFKDDAQ